MRIFASPAASHAFLPLVESSALKSEEKECCVRLFAKMLSKGHLGAGGSSRLDCLLKKMGNDSLILTPGEKKHYYVLKLKEPGDQEAKIDPVNVREGPYMKTKLQLAINSFKPKTEAEKIQALSHIRELINHPEIDINLTDAEGWSSAYQATQLVDPEVLSLILKHPDIRPSSKNADRSTPLIRAADRNNELAVWLLLKAKAKKDACNDVGTALTYAARKGHDSVVALLTLAGADLNKVSDPLMRPALKLALDGHHKDTAFLIREAGGKEVAEPGAMQKVVRTGGEALRAYLKENVNRRDEWGRTAVHYWAYEPSEETYRLLTELGADFALLDNYQRSALHYAAMAGQVDVIKTLLGKGLDVDQADNVKYSPLFWAAQFNRPDAAKELLARGAKPDHRDKFDWNPLDKAAESKSPAICEMLCPLLNVNRKATDGRTALHKAAVNGATDCIRVLLKFQADKTLEDGNGMKPVQYVPAKYTECFELLRV